MYHRLQSEYSIHYSTLTHSLAIHLLLTHSLALNGTHSLSLNGTHSLTIVHYTLTHSLTHSLTIHSLYTHYTITIHSLTHSLTHYTLTHSLYAHSLTYTHLLIFASQSRMVPRFTPFGFKVLQTPKHVHDKLAKAVADAVAYYDRIPTEGQVDVIYR